MMMTQILQLNLFETHLTIRLKLFMSNSGSMCRHVWSLLPTGAHRVTYVWRKCPEHAKVYFMMWISLLELTKYHLHSEKLDILIMLSPSQFSVKRILLFLSGTHTQNWNMPFAINKNCAWFQASASVWMIYLLFWDVLQCRLVVTDASAQPCSHSQVLSKRLGLLDPWRWDWSVVLKHQ